MMIKGYVWYSFGTDKSGPELAKALGFESGKKTPDPTKYSVIICWGAKLGAKSKYSKAQFAQLIAEGKLRLLNPIEAVETNRNKLATLKKMEAAGVMTPGIIEQPLTLEGIRKAVQEGRVRPPLLGLQADGSGTPTLHHTIEDADRAQKTVQYFRSFVPGTEYRVHVLRNVVLLVQKKQLAKDPVQACVTDLLDRLNIRLEKDANFAKLVPVGMRNPTTLGAILETAAREILVSANQVTRSVSHGWELADIATKDVPEKVKHEAVRALDAAGLDLGAVSVTMDEQDPHSRATVTGITTGPALPASHLSVYQQALRDFAAGGQAAEKAPEKGNPVEERKAPRELVAQVTEAATRLTEKDLKRLLAFMQEA